MAGAGGKSGGKQTTTTTQNYTPEQRAAQAAQYGAAGDWFFGPMGNPFQSSSGASTGYRGTILGGMGGSNLPIGSYGDRTAWMDLARSRVAGLDPNVQKAWTLNESLANDPNSSLNRAIGVMDDTASGKYLNNNPYLDKIYGNAANDIQNRVLGQFSTSGRTGSGASQDLLGKSLGDTYNNLYGQNYQLERDRQMRAAQYMPQFSAIPASVLGDVGNQRMTWNQRNIDAPLTALQQYGQLTSTANQPVGSSTSQPLYKNPIGSALGGAALGYGVGGPWGAAAGGTLGLLGGK